MGGCIHPLEDKSMTEAAINVDHGEIKKFAQLASRWWDPEGEFKPLHQINPLRLRYIDRWAPLAGRRVLDVGCGGGLLAEAMTGLGAEVTGIDLGEAALQVARLHLLESGCQVKYERIPVERLAEEIPGTFEVVTCMEMLEHVPDPASVVRACARLLRPGGRAFFSTLNRNPKAYLFAIIGAEYLLGILPRGTHDYAKFLRPSELGAMVRDAGLELRDIAGLSYDPLGRAYRLSRDVDVNYLVCCDQGDPAI
jgi:2-polyprenyl-6-hydroxyphenyl methylase / 3-demethylubiquinone-9 3-methyltransferase